MPHHATPRPSMGKAAALLALTALIAQPALAEPLRISGTGSSAPLVTALFEEFRKQHPDAELLQPTPPLGSSGALKALAGGRIDLALPGRALKPDEAARIGRHFVLATTPLVLASAGGQKKNGFTLDELAAVYEGRQTRWDNDQPIRLVLRASFESDTQTLKSMSPTMAKAVDTAARRPGMALGQDDLETLTLLTHSPGSLGPTTLGLLRASGARLTVFEINGVAPSLATLKEGRYPWRKEISVALPRQPSPLADKFAAFLQSDKAHAVLQRSAYLPAGR